MMSLLRLYRKRSICFFLLLPILAGCSLFGRPTLKEQINAEYIDNLINVAKSRLSLLTGTGADFCLFNKVKSVRHLIELSKNESESELFFDAQSTLFNVLRQIDEIKDLTIQLNESSDCFMYYQYTVKNKDMDKVDRYVARLKKFLNCQSCISMTKDNEINKHSVDRLKRIAVIISKYSEVFLIIRTHKNQSKLVKLITMTLRNNGVNMSQIVEKYTDEDKLDKNQLYFDFRINETLKIDKLKDWKKSFKLMAIKKETLYEP